MELIMLLGITVLVLWNAIAFAMYGIDKHKAQKDKWRISEAALISSAFLMGGIGAILGMRVFRHKTKHLKFKLLIPLAVVVNIGIIIFIHMFLQLNFS